MLQNIIIYPLLWVREHLGFNDVRMLNDASAVIAAELTSHRDHDKERKIMAYLATQRRPGTSAPGDGSRTITITPTPANEEGGSAEEGDSRGGMNEGGEPASTIVGALHLRGGARRTRARVAWDEDVVD
ncbi:hypothetical protein B0H14DRAFT_3455408 [Mycena olivaceomarginata]|nr:hypothetical protein B0H14DRAFT_3455408 [Mycena olivaceomarginata]